VAVDPNDGERRWFLGTLATIKISGEQSGGRLAIFESLLPREAAQPLHTHPQDETFYILEGEMTVWLNGVPKHCSPGTTVFFPGGAPHTFFVESDSARARPQHAGRDRAIRAWPCASRRGSCACRMTPKITIPNANPLKVF